MRPVPEQFVYCCNSAGPDSVGSSRLQPVFVIRAKAIPTPAQEGERLLWALADSCYGILRSMFAGELNAERPNFLDYVALLPDETLQILEFPFGAFSGWHGLGTVQSSSAGQSEVHEITLLRESGGVTLDYRVSTTSGSSPLHIDLAEKLFSAFRFEIDGQRIRNTVEAIDRRGVDKLVSRLTSTLRSIPMVVMSRNEQGRLTSDPKKMAERLIGLAHVVQLMDGPASEELGRRLGPELATLNGGVRIFWPGMSPSDSGYFHRVFTPVGPGDYPFADRLPGELFEIISRRSTLRNQLDPDVETAILAAQLDQLQPSTSEQDDTAVDELPQESRDVKKSDEVSLVHLIDQQHSTHEVVVHDLETRLLTSELARQQLEIDVFNLSERLKAAQMVNTYDPTSIEPLDLIAETLETSTLADLVAIFERTASGDAIVFLPEAHESAGASPYAGNLAGPAKMLRNLCTVATRYHTGDLRDGEDFKRAFHQAGEARYASDSSPTTLGKYRIKYERTYVTNGRAQTILLRPHMSFGSGRAHSSVKIYWYVDETNRRFVVGQIGEHLPIAKRF